MGRKQQDQKKQHPHRTIIDVSCFNIAMIDDSCFNIVTYNRRFLFQNSFNINLALHGIVEVD
jgi:hypothetical protein